MDFQCDFRKGIPKRADDIINDPDFEPLRQEAFKMSIVPLCQKHKISAYTVTEFLENNKDRAELIFDLWQNFLLDIMLIQNDAPSFIIPQI